MTRSEFQALFPEFGASTYNARIDLLLTMIPPYSADKLGNQLMMAQGLWVAGKLAAQDISIQFGTASSSASSSSTTEKKVGDVSIKRSLAQSTSSGNGSGARVGETTYDARLRALLQQAGMGVLVSPGVVAETGVIA